MAGKKKRVAVYFSGRVKGCERCLDGIWTNLVALHDADIFVSLDATAEETAGDPSFAALVHKAGAALKHVEFRKYENAEWMRPAATVVKELLTYEEIGPVGSPFYKRILKNTSSQLYNNKQCTLAALRHARTEGFVYDVIVKFRADIHLSDPMRFDHDIGPGTLYVPVGCDHHGLNDQIGYGGSAVMYAYGTAYDRLIEFLARRIPFNAEGLCLEQAVFCGLTVARVPLRWSLEKNRVGQEYGANNIAVAKACGVAPTRHLVYYAIGGPDPAYVELLELSLASLVYSLAVEGRQFTPGPHDNCGGEVGDTGVDVLVMCDASWVPRFEKAKRIAKLGGVGFHMLETDDNEGSGVKACMRKIEVFDWKGLAEYGTALYLDCDVVVTGDVVGRIMDPVLASSIPTGDRWGERGLLRVRTEAYPLDNPWFSLPPGPSGYSPQQLADMTAEGLRPFNCGQFAFVPLADGVQEHFAAVRMLVKGHSGDHFYEQSFMNHHFNLRRATDRGALLDSQVVLFARGTRVPGATLHHVCDASLGRETKLAAMRAIASF